MTAEVAAPLAGKTALITGASAPKGIGRAIAHRLAQDGARVVVTDLNAPFEQDGQRTERQHLLTDLAATLTRQGHCAHATTLDVTRADDIARVVADIRARFGTIDILVNNAGSLAGSDAFMSTTPEEWTQSFQVNLLGPMMLTQAVLPLMQSAGDGQVINIGSTGSLGAEPGFGAYTTMKHGLVGFTKTIAAEFGVDGIRCNMVCPGYIATDMHEAANARLALERGEPMETIRAQRYSNVALRRAGRPDEVADAVAYLTGPGARYVTGILLPVAGGVPAGI